MTLSINLILDSSGMSGRHAINVIENLVFIRELPIVAHVGHRVRVPHRIILIALQERQTLVRLDREMLLDLRRVIYVDVPILLLNVPQKLIKWLHFSQVGHRPNENQLLLRMCQRGEQPPNVLQIHTFLVVFNA